MNDKKTIKWMKKASLVALLEETIETINEIESFSEKVKSIFTELDSSNQEITWDWWAINTIKDWEISAQSMIEEIERYRSRLLIDNDEEDYISIDTQIQTIFNDIEEKREKVTSFSEKLFWYLDEETQEEVLWLSSEIERHYLDQKNKYDKLYLEIETKLKWWATSVSLAKAFADKVDEYRKSTKLWSQVFICIMLVVILYLWVITFSLWVLDVNQVLLWLLNRSPFLIFVIWLSIFISNRRAESKKLQESYAHKSVMARSYFWYRESVEELDTKDNELLEKHMSNLLDAINFNSSSFLQNSWEKHPFFDLFAKLAEKVGVWWLPKNVVIKFDDDNIS